MLKIALKPTDVEDFTRLLIDAAYRLSFSLPVDHGRMTVSVTKPEGL
jgi:hypothetical protein